MSSSLAKAREAAKAAQTQRVESLIAKRASPAPALAAKKLQIPPKRKQMATPAKAAETPSKMPKLATPVKRTKAWGACALCNVVDDKVDATCVVCNNKLHLACATTIARGVNVEAFTIGAAYCSFPCYYSNNSGRKLPNVAYATPVKAPGSSLATPSRRFSTPLETTPSRFAMTTPTKQLQSPTESTSEPWKLKSKSKYVEGDDIKTVLFTHSGVKARRSRSVLDDDSDDDEDDENTSLPPLSRRLVPNTPARQSLPTPTRPFPPTHRPATPRRPSAATQTPLSSADTPKTPATIPSRPVSTPAATPSPQAATPSTNERPPPSSSERHRPTYLKVESLPQTPRGYSYPQWVILLVLAGMAITASLLLTLAYMDAMPMCDSESVDEMSSLPSLHCHRCPEFGHCHSGELHSCREPYVLVERRCVESDQVRQDAHLMAELLDSFLMRRASSAFCNGSWVDLLLFGNDDGSSQQIVVSATEQIGYLRNQANWKESSDVVFVAAYSKATTQLAAQSSTRFFQDDGQVALTVLDASALCWTVLELHEHLYIYASTFFGALGVLYLYSQVQKSKYRKLLFTKMLQAVHGELRRLEESDNALDGAVDGLRREILERFFPHATDSREATRLWTSIAAHVQRDARVRERHVMHRGQQVLVWEWIDARRQTATRVEPPLVAGQAVNYSTTSY